MKILIVTGGSSSERKISLISAKAVKEALEENRHKVKLFDYKKGFINLKKIIPKFDVIFPVLHGEEGEGGELQKFLSKTEKPFVGGDWKGFRKGWYKIPFKRFCDKNNIPTPIWKLVKQRRDIVKFGFPCVLKASNGGSSLEVVMIPKKNDLKKTKVNKLLKSKMPLFVEKLIKGVDITISVLGDQALPVIEIVPPENEWFSYENKYSSETKEIPFAPSIAQDLQKKAQAAAIMIHKELNLGHFSRIDFIVSDTTIYAIDVNTIPGMTPKSLFPKAAQAVGLNFPKLVQRLAEMARDQK